MKAPKLIIFVFVVSTALSCKIDKAHPTNNKRRLIIDNLIAEGDISSDSVYNGLIKFYDKGTNKLIIDANYKNGKLNGIRKDYYLNGKIRNISFYENGRQNGPVSYFDSTGQLTSKQDFYFALKVGNRIEYKNESPSKYSFTSFDNEDLFYIDYDSIFNKEIKQINNNSFFFWHIYDIPTNVSSNKRLKNIEYFIYLINPPDFNFEYSLCVINKKDSIVRTEKKFDQAKIWDTFFIDTTKLGKDERFTLRLVFERELNDSLSEKGDMLKKI